MADKKRNSPDDDPKKDHDPEEFRATLVEHIEELRTRIVRSLWLLVAGWAIGWFIERPLYGYLNTQVQKIVVPALHAMGREYREPFHSATEPFFLQLKLSLFIGITLAFPFIILQIWGFIAPGLKPNERRPFRIIAPLSLFLFFLGAFFCWLIIPTAMGWFVDYIRNFPGTDLFQEPGTMVFFILKMLFAFGLGFQLPLVVYALGALNLLSGETLIKYWRHAVVVIFVLASIITPSNDPISMLMMAIPLCVLFMISVYFVRLTQKRQKQKPRIIESGQDDVKKEDEQT